MSRSRGRVGGVPSLSTDKHLPCGHRLAKAPLKAREPMGARVGVAWALRQVRAQARLSPIACSKELVRGERPQAAPCPSHLTGDKKDGARLQFLGRKGDWLIHPRGHVSQQRWHQAAQKPLPLGGVNWKQGTYLEGGCQAPHFLGGDRWPWACLPETGSDGLGSRYPVGAAGCTRGSLQPLPTKSPPKFALGRREEIGRAHV